MDSSSNSTDSRVFDFINQMGTSDFELPTSSPTSPQDPRTELMLQAAGYLEKNPGVIDRLNPQQRRNLDKIKSSLSDSQGKLALATAAVASPVLRSEAETQRSTAQFRGSLEALEAEASKPSTEAATYFQDLIGEAGLIFGEKEYPNTLGGISKKFKDLENGVRLLTEYFTWLHSLDSDLLKEELERKSTSVPLLGDIISTLQENLLEAIDFLDGEYLKDGLFMNFQSAGLTLTGINTTLKASFALLKITGKFKQEKLGSEQDPRTTQLIHDKLKKFIPHFTPEQLFSQQSLQ